MGFVEVHVIIGSELGAYMILDESLELYALARTHFEDFLVGSEFCHTLLF